MTWLTNHYVNSDTQFWLHESFTMNQNIFYRNKTVAQEKLLQTFFFINMFSLCIFIRV